MTKKCKNTPAAYSGRMGGGLLTVCAVSVLLAGCGEETKKQLGLTKTAPDEFAVVTRAPLSVPPDYTLRPPRPGMQRPMEQTTVDQAKQTLFGVEDVNQSAAKGSASPDFLNQLGVNEADGSIRETLREESKADVEDKRPVAEKLLFWNKGDGPRGDVIDPKAELQKGSTSGTAPATNSGTDSGAAADE